MSNDFLKIFERTANDIVKIVFAISAKKIFDWRISFPLKRFSVLSKIFLQFQRKNF